MKLTSQFTFVLPPNVAIISFQKFYDSDEQELGDLCEFYAEQEDFDFDALDASNIEVRTKVFSVYR